MKRYLAVALMMLLLSGCAGNLAPDMDQTPQDYMTEGALYAPDSAAEQQTNGAVTMYPLPEGKYELLSIVGDKLLLLTGEEEKKVVVMSGEQGILSGPVAIPVDFALDGVWQPTYNGLVYFDVAARQAVMLDTQLQELKRIDLPELDGTPVFTDDCARIYYCKGQEIRAMELELGIDRLIRTHSCQKQTLKGCLFGGKVLICELTDEAGQQRTLYLSSETGQSLSENQNILSISSADTYYLASLQEGTLTQQVAGSLEGAPMMLLPKHEKLYPVLALNGVLGYNGGTDRILDLAFYDLQSGKITAAVKIRGVGDPERYLTDKWSKSVWFLSQDPATNRPAMFRWKIEKSGVENGVSCLSTWYNATNPDTVGISKLKDRANKLGNTYGVSIRIWQDAVKTADKYILEPEHQTAAISAALDQLEKVLSSYPSKFLSKSASGKIRICILRSISREITGAQFWSGSDPYILLSVGCDMKSEFSKALGCVVTSRILGNTTIMDSWQSLNPAGFQYGASPDKSLLEGNTRAFADADAAKSVTEDRSRVFWQAMQPDNKELFASETMQKKLTMLCKAIRDAYGMKKRTEVFPWEQYLNQPIAYVK